MSNKMSFICELFFILLIVMNVRSDAKNGDICSDGLLDAITEVQNKSIIFRGINLWLLIEDKLSGPFPIKYIFNEMNGHINSAVTIGVDTSVIDFTGASIYFSGDDFYLYKNFRSYQIEWGTLVYMPHKGVRNQIGSINKQTDNDTNVPQIFGRIL